MSEKKSKGIVEKISMDKQCLQIEGQKYWFIWTKPVVELQVKVLNKGDNVELTTIWNTEMKRTEILSIHEVGGVGHEKFAPTSTTPPLETKIDLRGTMEKTI